MSEELVLGKSTMTVTDHGEKVAEFEVDSVTITPDVEDESLTDIRDKLSKSIDVHSIYNKPENVVNVGTPEHIAVGNQFMNTMSDIAPPDIEYTIPNAELGWRYGAARIGGKKRDKAKAKAKKKARKLSRGK